MMTQKRRRLRTVALPIIVGLATVSLAAQGKQDDRLRDSTLVLREILTMPDGVPQSVLDRSECVMVFPSVKKVALGVGGSYGRGVMTCRTGEAFDGPWSAPAMMALEGGSLGFQVGGEARDFLLLIMNERGANSVLSSKTKLGADATATAGPKGKTVEAATDAGLTAEILTYSRSRGLFAGVSINGSSLRGDGDGNTAVYGRDLTPREIVRGKHPVPKAAQELIDLLAKRSPKRVK